jgi:hypothetical protein
LILDRDDLRLRADPDDMKRLVALGGDDEEVACNMGDAFRVSRPFEREIPEKRTVGTDLCDAGGRLITVNSVSVVVE